MNTRHHALALRSPCRERVEVRPTFTRRELDVIRLIAGGLSNRAIADALTIAPATAERHVANILRKLDFTSRLQVAVWAVRQGLDLDQTSGEERFLVAEERD